MISRNHTFQSNVNPEFSKHLISVVQLMLARKICVCCDIDLIALFFYRVKDTEEIGDVLSRVRAVKNIHLLLEKWRVRQRHRPRARMTENASSYPLQDFPE